MNKIPEELQRQETTPGNAEALEARARKLAQRVMGKPAKKQEWTKTREAETTAVGAIPSSDQSD